MARLNTVSSATPTIRTPLPRGFWVIWTTVALDLVGFGIVAPILGRYAERFGANPFTVGLLFASFSMAQFLCAPVLVVGELQVVAAGVEVEILAEQTEAHHHTLAVPAGTTVTPR